jgi:hypothetical protein
VLFGGSALKALGQHGAPEGPCVTLDGWENQNLPVRTQVRTRYAMQPKRYV